MIKTAKKRNPQDATLRNVRALKKRVEVLEGKVKDLNARVNRLETKTR